RRAPRSLCPSKGFETTTRRGTLFRSRCQALLLRHASNDIRGFLSQLKGCWKRKPTGHGCFCSLEKEERTVGCGPDANWSVRSADDTNVACQTPTPAGTNRSMQNWQIVRKRTTAPWAPIR
ncbi:unnamed protein product, partial [Hapterophycus canaliculatus]